MAVRRISGPAPIVAPDKIAGSPGPTDPVVAAQILAVQRSIDGPTGWLGRALGKQTLELSLETWERCGDYIRLPYPPLISITSVKYIDSSDVEQTVPDTDYLKTDFGIWFRPSFSAPYLSGQPEPIRIRYEAGYEADDVPEEAKQAVILMVQQLRAVGSENLFLRSEEVEGVGTTQYTVSDQAENVIRRACESLLQGLRVYA
ncbi:MULTISPECIES: hypothetical protein [unclassified Rhizobium]|uniref:hypothetical protein n=1 Tax=unclassified Rhizobium TaxID=2613769 RepID=UPI00071479BF|nr:MULTISPECIES: hypothetical protein [unclassified Rhizobium]KQT03208.1 hypothetical protein ASG42_24685 [Rhizobium sp. Leaf391]KQU08397.1 hypothetical protein ASG68_22675 [Rhizobium sp. Leaf453]